MRSRYKIVDKYGLYFMTSTIVEWLPVFTRKEYFEIIIQSLKYCRENKGLNLFAYVIMDNHIHLIVTAENLSKVIQDFKSFTAKEIIKTVTAGDKKWLLNQLAYYKKKHKKGSTYQVWQEGMYPQQILSDVILKQKIEYIHNNPVKAGFVERPEYWMYSSASNYLLGQGIMDIDLYKF